MFWIPPVIWSEEKAYIIGGGPSLRFFDFALLKDKNTIGCNHAFLLGEEICKICFFGDIGFFEKNKSDLSQFGGIVVTNTPRMNTRCPDWVKRMRRERRGLSAGSGIGWNYSSGAAATNLALSLGARTIYLLGMDLCGGTGNHNWHERQPTKVYDETYNRFLQGWRSVYLDLPKLFPGREVIQLTESEGMGLFKTESLRDHFKVEIDNVDCNRHRV